MRQMGKELGLKVVYEAFPDRAYTSDGTLVSRKQPGAVITDPLDVAKRRARIRGGCASSAENSPERTFSACADASRPSISSADGKARMDIVNPRCIFHNPMDLPPPPLLQV